MKHIKTPLSERGFALVVTLALMMLLALVAVGLLSLATITTRSSQATAMSVARANARMALILAIGDLQKYTGPDQRVTANAEMTGATQNKNWTGVWSTTQNNTPEKPMILGHTDPAVFTDLRSGSTNWKTDQRLAWLVSGTSPAPGTTSGSVKMVAEGSLGTNYVSSHADEVVTAPTVELVDKNTKKAGSYAYWIGDESQKARIDYASPYNNKSPSATNPTDGGYYRLTGAEGPNFSKVKNNDTGSTPYATVESLTAEQRSKSVTRNSVGLFLSSPKDAMPSFHDITVSSESVLADVTGRGLKKDLTAVIQNSTDIAAAQSVPGTGIQASQQILPGPRYADSGPYFEHLRNWYDLRKQITGNLASASVPAPIYPETRPGFTGSTLDTSSLMPNVKSRKPSLVPIMTDIRMAYDFSLDPTRAEGGPDPSTLRYAIRTHLYPRVTLWNPYNVTIPGQRYIVGCRSPQLSGGGLKFNGLSLVNTTTFPDGGNRFFAGLSNVAYIYFVTESIDLAPGETLVFSPDVSASSGPSIAYNSTKYNGANIANNILSAKVPFGTNNFYFNSGYKIDGQINPTANLDYGLNGGVNQAYANAAPGAIFKKYDTSGSSLTLTQVLTNSPVLQYMAASLDGKVGSWWWYIYNNAKAGYNAGQGLRIYPNRPDQNPPRIWNMQMRLRYLNESDEAGGVSISHGGRAPALMYNNSAIGNFNVRASMNHRDPFSFCNGWPRSTPGNQMITWAPLPWNDGRMTGPVRNGKSYGSPFANPGEITSPPSYVLFDVPRQDTPIFSLACFQHAQLSPHGFGPTYVIGNSNAEPRSATPPTSSPASPAQRNRTVSTNYYAPGGSLDPWGPNFRRNNTAQWSQLLDGMESKMLIYDSSYSLNQVLWDKFFLSTIPYSSSGTITWNPDTETLPNSHLALRRKLTSAEKTLLSSSQHFNYASYFLTNRGAFNINSTRVEAWRALFSTLNDVPRPTGGNSVTGAFSRLLTPVSDNQPGGVSSAGAWSGVKKLSEAEIEKLAETMVAVVKERGPFLSLADFVNRRLDVAASNPSMTDPTLCGPLQAAIERAEINKSLQSSGDMTNTSWGGNSEGGGLAFDNTGFYPYKNFGLPGYLTQADVLQTIGASLTARGDTFLIRAYGDAKDSSGNITATAYCEAIVQREPDYLAGTSANTPSDSAGNNPMEPLIVDSTTGFTVAPNSKILSINQKFGRKFKIQQFRWLSGSEI